MAEERLWRRRDWYGRTSEFPPCAFCGAPYEAHELVGPTGIREHRIDAPGMPQHGQVHPFSPMPPDTPLNDEQGASITNRAPEIRALADFLGDWEGSDSGPSTVRALALLADQSFEETKLMGLTLTGLREDVRRVIRLLNRKDGA